MCLSSHSKERTGYPTQKPLALLRRIIEASSRKGDLILDPFCGCGTTIAACHETKRRFVGIDVARSAAQVIAGRMKKHYPGFGRLRVGDKTPKNTRGWGKILPDSDERGDIPAWARFQYDAIAAIPKAEQYEGESQGTPKQGADGGIDGRIKIRNPKNGVEDTVIIQVKRKKQSGKEDVADTLLTVESTNAFMGLLITLNEPTRGMRELGRTTMRQFHGKPYPRVAILTYDQVKAGEYEDAVPYDFALDPEEGESAAQKFAKNLKAAA